MNRFFLTGCEGSGVALLRRALNSHPDIQCFDGSVAISMLRRGERVESGCQTVVGFQVPVWSNCQSVAPWTEHDAASSSEIQDLGEPERYYRGEPILFMLRDVRDVVSAMLRLNPAVADMWLEELASLPGDQRGENTLPQLKHWQRPRSNPDSDSTANGGGVTRAQRIGTLYWKHKNSAVFEYIRRGYPVLTVRYEELTRDPRAELRRVMRFLDLECDERVVRVLRDSPHDVSEAPRASVSTASHPRTTSDSRNKSSVEFTPSYSSSRDTLRLDEEREIIAIAGDVYRRLGYAA